MKNLLTNKKRCAIIQKLLTKSNEHNSDESIGSEKKVEKLKKLFENLLTNEKRCAIIIRLSQRVAAR